MAKQRKQRFVKLRQRFSNYRTRFRAFRAARRAKRSASGKRGGLLSTRNLAIIIGLGGLAMILVNLPEIKQRLRIGA